MKIGKSYLLYVGLLCVLGCAGVVLYLTNNNTIDPVLQDMYTQKAQYETLLSQQITENKKTEAILQSGRLSEHQYRSQKDNIQEQINAYIHTQSTGNVDFPQERETPKTTNKKMTQNISEDQLKRELGLLQE